MYRDTLTHSTLPTCTRSGAAKSTPTVNGTPLRPPWDGSHMKSSPSPLWCGGGVVLSLSPPWCGGVWYCPSPPSVVWWGCGTVPSPPCGVVGVWYCPPPPCGVVGVWYGMLGMYGVYGRSGMACLESMVCLVCMVGMLCMA